MSDSTLNAASFAVSGLSSAPTRLLRRVASIKLAERCIPFLAYLAIQHRETIYGPILQQFVERELDRFDELSWSPLFRAWWADVGRLADWETLASDHVALLDDFCAQILCPDQPQDYLSDVAIALSPGGRYAPPGLDWCWVSKDPQVDKMRPASLARVAEAARALTEGDSDEVETDECAGRVYKSFRLGGETFISNLHPRLKVHLSGTNERETGVLHRAVDWQGYLDEWDIKAFYAPYELMAYVWPEEFADQLEILKVVVPMTLPADMQKRKQYLAFTLSSCQGAIFVTPAHPVTMLEMLLHEKAHVKQRYVEEVWPLLEPEQTPQRFAVPWRPDPRPISGIFEGINVFLQVAIGLSKCHRAGCYDVRNQALDVFCNIKYGLDLIGSHARMTSDGQMYYEEIRGAYEAAHAELLDYKPAFQTTNTF